MSNGLDSDQDRHPVAPDLGPNCLQRLRQTTKVTASRAQWLSGRVLDSRLGGRRLEPHRSHCVVFLSKNINPSLVLVQPRKICPFITERLLMGHKESNQTNNNHR